MIDHKNQLIFIHIPKTAGRSIHHLLFGHEITDPHRKSLSLLHNLDNYTDYLSFTIVRNPLDRLVSIYHHYLNGGNGSKYDKAIGTSLKEKEFRSFILNIDNLSLPYYEEIKYMLYNQTYYIYRNEQKYIDHIFYFERLGELSFYLSKHYNLPSLPHINKTCHDYYLSYYDSEMIEFIKHKYASDFNLLGYF